MSDGTKRPPPLLVEKPEGGKKGRFNGRGGKAAFMSATECEGDAETDGPPGPAGTAAANRRKQAASAAAIEVARQLTLRKKKPIIEE